MEATITARCPSCNGTDFVAHNGRERARCVTCRTVERNRVARLFIDKYIKPQPGWRVLHCAPEPDLFKYFTELCGRSYEPRDFNPASFKKRFGIKIGQIDLCADAARLERDSYDLVVHNHVIEHVPCNWSCVLSGLHRAIKPGGYHLFSVPMWRGSFREDLDPELTREERKARFGQHNHWRRFGVRDIDRTLGALFPEITSRYTLLEFFTRDELLGANVPEEHWTCSGSSVFMVRKPAKKPGWLGLVR